MRAESVRKIVDPVVTSLGLELFDLLVDARTVQVVIDREGGVDLDALTVATRAVSAALDAAGQQDPGLGSGSYSLEVSSPGLERPLRTPAHFRRATGATVSVRICPPDGADEAIRLRGTLVHADDERCTIDVDGAPVDVTYTDIVAARTVFEWGPAPKPSSGGRRKKRAKKKVASR